MVAALGVPRGVAGASPAWEGAETHRELWLHLRPLAASPGQRIPSAAAARSSSAVQPTQMH